MNDENILFVCKLSKIEYDKILYSFNTRELIDFYNKKKLEWESILCSHVEQKMCIHTVKQLFPKSSFIVTKELNKDVTKDKEIIVSIGGDEHFKYVIHNSEDILTFSIRSDNLKSEGQLSTCNRHTVDLVAERIKDNSYNIQKWARLDCELDGKPIESSIDTIFIGNKISSKISRYVIKYKDIKEEQKSSGIIIVTGTGSTGWFSSMHGKPFSRIAPKGKFRIRELYRGTKTAHSLEEGELDNKEALEIISLMDNKSGIINIDSIIDYPFPRGSTLKINVSQKILKVLTIDENL